MNKKYISLISYIKKGQEGNLIPLHEPSFSNIEKEAICDCIDSTFVSSVGTYVNSIEEKLSNFLNVKHVIATSRDICTSCCTDYRWSRKLP